MHAHAHFLNHPQVSNAVMTNITQVTSLQIIDMSSNPW